MNYNLRHFADLKMPSVNYEYNGTETISWHNTLRNKRKESLEVRNKKMETSKFCMQIVQTLYS